MSNFLSGSRSTGSPEPHPQIVLRDNTVPSTDPPPTPPSEDVSPRSSGLFSGRKNGVGHRETLRKAIAQRKYRRWELSPGEAEARDEDEEPPDERAGGVVVERDSGMEDSVYRGRQGGSGDTGKGGNGAGAGSSSVPNVVNGTGVKAKGTRKKEIAEMDVLYENQRGVFCCGIPLFSSRGLLNFDPAPWQNSLFNDSAVSIVNAQVPDPSWVWDWKTWYVDMTADVDEEGWAYSFSFSPLFSWHGTHVWFHSFVRRRRWLRKRVKITAADARDTSTERAGHHLNGDYFTIHSRSGPNARASVVTTSAAPSEEEDEIPREIEDVPKLMRVLRKCRLDREKIDAVMRFVMTSGDEVTYLPPHVDAIMRQMIFQASRRQLLAHLIGFMNEMEEILQKNGRPASKLSETSKASETESTSSQRPLLPESGPEAAGEEAKEAGNENERPFGGVVAADGTDESREAKVDQETHQRRVKALKAAVQAADEEVRKLEFWSDIKGVAQRGESISAQKGWDQDLGLSGPAGPGFHRLDSERFANEKASETKDENSPHLDTDQDKNYGAAKYQDKGKGKEVER